MAIDNSVSNDFLSSFFDCINFLDCRLPGVSLDQDQAWQNVRPNLSAIKLFDNKNFLQKIILKKICS